MIKACRGRLDPLQPAVSHDFGPGDGDFGVAAENIGQGEFGSDPFLARIDHLRSRWARGHNLFVVAGFEGVAEDKAHGK